MRMVNNSEVERSVQDLFRDAIASARYGKAGKDGTTKPDQADRPGPIVIPLIAVDDGMIIGDGISSIATSSTQISEGKFVIFACDTISQARTALAGFIEGRAEGFSSQATLRTGHGIAIIAVDKNFSSRQGRVVTLQDGRSVFSSSIFVLTDCQRPIWSCQSK